MNLRPVGEEVIWRVDVRARVRREREAVDGRERALRDVRDAGRFEARVARARVDFALGERVAEVDDFARRVHCLVVAVVAVVGRALAHFASQAQPSVYILYLLSSAWIPRMPSRLDSGDI